MHDSYGRLLEDVQISEVTLSDVGVAKVATTPDDASVSFNLSHSRGIDSVHFHPVSELGPEDIYGRVKDS